MESKGTVLICDDNSFMRMKLKGILTKNGYTVIAEAPDGTDAVRLYNELRPDVVTMDITMVEMNGIEALKGIKAMDPKAKVVMVTAMGQAEMLADAFQAGASDFIGKPFADERVIEAMEKVLR